MVAATASVGTRRTSSARHDAPPVAQGGHVLVDAAHSAYATSILLAIKMTGAVDNGFRCAFGKNARSAQLLLQQRLWQRDGIAPFEDHLLVLNMCLQAVEISMQMIKVVRVLV